MTDRNRLRAVSLRRRVMWLSVAAMAVLMAVMLTATTVILSRRLEGDLVARLEDRARLASTIAPDSDLQTIASSLTDDEITTFVSRGDGEAVGRVDRERWSRRGPRDHDDDRPGAPPHGDIVATRQVRLSDGTIITLTASSGEIHRFIGRLVSAEILVAGVTAAGLAITVRSLARRTLAPLDEMVSVAERIADGERGTRLEPSRGDTDLGRLATSFDSMVAALEDEVGRSERSEATMRQFLADASHELRNPTAAIGATAERLIHGDLDDAEREQLAVDVVRESRRMGRLVSDLLDVARLEDPAAGTPPVEPVDLGALATDEVERARIAAHRPCRIEVVTAEPEPLAAGAVLGDRTALGRVIANLLDNACTHAPDDSLVTVEIGVTERDGVGVAILRLLNDGPAIDPADRERIFERFTRLDRARSRHQGGSGLGLAISRAIARAHGGELRCIEPPPGRGAAFELQLPLTEWQHAPHAPHDA